MTELEERVGYTQMKHGTREDYELLFRLRRDDRDFVIDNCFNLLQQMAGPAHGHRIDRYQHSLQSATRALRDEVPDDLVVAALLHDVADEIAPDNHSEVAAAILRPFVSESTYWVVKHHGIFQGYYYFHHVGRDRDEREQYKDSEHYKACVRFCERYDQNCFDPDYDTMPLEEFVPIVERVFATRRFDFV